MLRPSSHVPVTRVGSLKEIEWDLLKLGGLPPGGPNVPRHQGWQELVWTGLCEEGEMETSQREKQQQTQPLSVSTGRKSWESRSQTQRGRNPVEVSADLWVPCPATIILLISFALLTCLTKSHLKKLIN